MRDQELLGADEEAEDEEEEDMEEEDGRLISQNKSVSKKRAPSTVKVRSIPLMCTPPSTKFG